MQLQNRRRFIIIGLLIIALILGALFIPRSPKKNTGGGGGIYVDPLSHETISNPAGKAPDTYGAAANNPLYLGFDKLLDHGITFNQLSNVKLAFYKYSQSQSPHIKEISLDVDHITTSYKQTATSSVFFVLFNGRFDRAKPFNAKVQYTGLNDIQLILSDSSGHQIYDSGVISAPGD